MVMFPVHQVWPNHLARHSERGKKTRRTKEDVGRQHQGMDRPGVWQVPEGSGEQGKMEKTGCKIICGVPNDPHGKGIDDDDDDDDFFSFCCSNIFRVVTGIIV